MLRYRSLCAGLGFVLFGGCADETWPPTVSPEAYAAEYAQWRSERRDRLVTPPSGPVLWIGLWELPAGATPFGSDPSLSIVLPAEDAPARSGVLLREGDRVRLEPEPGAPLSIRDGAPLEGPIDLAHDRQDQPTDLSLGSLGLRIHAERGTDRLWLRVWDEDMPDRATFELPEAFPVDMSWHVPARFEPFAEPRALRVRDVTSGTLEYRAPGELVFEVDGVERRLIATASEESTSFFVMLWDETARTETYQAGRYLRVPFPDERGRTVIDFNRAYNAPCVFTAHSVCALPPPENHLSLAVTAGEKRRAEP